MNTIRDLTFWKRQCKWQRRLRRKSKCACAAANVAVLAKRARRHFVDFALRGNGIDLLIFKVVSFDQFDVFRQDNINVSYFDNLGLNILYTFKNIILKL